jgi:hypothetical protein
MQIETDQFKKIAYLRSRVAEMYGSGVNSSELGNVALELLAIRNDLETKSDELSKEKLEKFTQSLRELEKTVISLYMLSMLSDNKQHGIEGHLFRRQYSIYQKR